jgi:hypothetical protein
MWSNDGKRERQHSYLIDKTIFPVFGVNSIPSFAFLLPKTGDFAFPLPRAAVHGEQ